MLPSAEGGKILNFTMVLNTVSYTTLKDIKFAKRIQQLFVRNFDLEEKTLHIPEVFKKILSSEVPFETVTSDLAQDLVLKRQDTMIGHKCLIYALQKEWTDEMDSTRSEIFNFFRNSLGFKINEIITIPGTELGEY